MNPTLAISPELENLVLSCLAKSADERPDSMDAVLTALKRTAGGALTGTMASYAGTGELRTLSSSDANAALGAVTGVNRLSRTGSLQPPAFGEVSGAQQAAPEAPAASKAVPAAIGGLVFAGVIGFFVWRSAQPEPVPPPPAPVPVAAPAPAPEPAPAPKAPAQVIVELKSNPTGAAVFDAAGVQRCGATPCSLVLKGEEAADGATVRLKLRKDGFREREFAFQVGKPVDEITLERAAPVFVPGPAAPRPKAPEGSSAPSKDFKDDPY
jgi:hypothetical protein